MAMKRSMVRGGLSWLALLLCLLSVLAALWPEAKAIGNMSITASESTESLDSPLIINDSTIDSAIRDYSPFVLDCWKQGCTPCQLMGPTVDEMAHDLKGRVAFGKLRIDQNYKTKLKYRIYHYPMLLIFKNGSLVDEHLGNYPRAVLEGLILERLGMN
jgi:thioredoxin 1